MQAVQLQRPFPLVLLVLPLLLVDAHPSRACSALCLGRIMQDGLKKLNVPYSYGWSIVALTAVIKLVTFPLTKKQAGAAGSQESAVGCFFCAVHARLWMAVVAGGGGYA